MYVRYLEPGHNELWVSDVDGSNRLKLASGSLLATLDWSADNTLVAFSDGSHLFARASRLQLTETFHVQTFGIE